MTTTLYTQAELTFSAYATLNRGPNTENIQRLQQAGLSAKQAEEFAKRYPETIAQFNDTLVEGGLGTSFSATVFKGTGGDLTVAIRGTQEAGDFVPTDSTIAINGTGYDQIVAMANWWRRVASPAGQTVQQHRIVGYAPTAPIPSGALFLYSGLGVVYFLEAAPPAAATGQLSNALGQDSDQRVDVVGHSLGGHLALAFNGLFSPVASQITVFNAPGFTDTETNRQFFSALGGAIPAVGNSSNVINVVADEASTGTTPWNAVAALHSRLGTAVDVPIENQWLSDEPNPAGALNHSQMVLTDSLALYGALSTLAPAFTLAEYKAILNQAVRGTAAGYERIVDALETLFQVNTEPLPTGNSKRDSLYAALYEVQSSLPYIVSRLRVDSSRFSNVRASAGLSPIAGVGLPVSPPITIEIENQFVSDVPNPPAARNHSQQVLTDSLGVLSIRP